ncbi:uncharacterized protein LOC9638651 [Selaginella moellendorffii]|nr:uncharacterized protein LOC9638651 [Selaginella moellendorffii]|eukprot:XP_002977067.2 uncharacterized protein LOC9638651 [Selaginella moellendorffii]
MASSSALSAAATLTKSANSFASSSSSSSASAPSRKSGSFKCGMRIRAESDGSKGSTTKSPPPVELERSPADKLVDGMSFGQLCDEFQCISSPSVESTCRQLARDILEIRDGNRALGTLAYFVKYKDPLRSFQGRLKYNRPSWTRTALENPTVAVRQMEMVSTSVLRIQWTIQGRPKLAAASFVGDVLVNVTSTFTLNQISGQVLEHREEWDLSGNSPLAQAYFWLSRIAYSTVEAGKDTSELVQGVSKVIDKNLGDDSSIYVDPTDPKKFFQVDDNRQKDIYQVGLVLALLYLLVQFLKLTL